VGNGGGNSRFGPFPFLPSRGGRQKTKTLGFGRSPFLHWGLSQWVALIAYPLRGKTTIFKVFNVRWDTRRRRGQIQDDGWLSGIGRPGNTLGIGHGVRGGAKGPQCGRLSVQSRKYTGGGKGRWPGTSFHFLEEMKIVRLWDQARIRGVREGIL